MSLPIFSCVAWSDPQSRSDHYYVQEVATVSPAWDQVEVVLPPDRISAGPSIDRCFTEPDLEIMLAAAIYPDRKLLLSFAAGPYAGSFVTVLWTGRALAGYAETVWPLRQGGASVYLSGADHLPIVGDPSEELGPLTLEVEEAALRFLHEYRPGTGM